MSGKMLDGDCRNLIKPHFDRLVENNEQAIAGAMGGEFSDEIEELLAGAVEKGCSHDQSKDAIIQLAREYKGARGAIFD